MSSEVKRKERQDLLVQVEDFLNKQQFQAPQQKKEVQQEVNLFLNLLGNINNQETPQSQNQNQLSTIYSQGSQDSTLPSFRETKYKYVDQFVQQMLQFLREVKTNKLQDIKYTIDSIYVIYIVLNRKQFYLNQMNDIDKLIQYSYDVGNRKNISQQLQQDPIIRDSGNKQTNLEIELENSLIQAQQLNEQLNNMLKQKTNDNYYKDKQCKQALQSVALLESQLKQFQGSFKQFNSIVKVINGKLNEVVNGGANIEPRINKMINKGNYKQVNSYRTHFNNTTPNKKNKLEENYRSTSQNSYRSRRDELDKVYKQLLKNYN